MILSDIRRYMAQHGQATLADVALHFDIVPDAARGILEVLVNKGMLEHRMLSASCGSSCSQCDPASTEIYLWRDASKPSNMPQLKCQVGSRG